MPEKYMNLSLQDARRLIELAIEGDPKKRAERLEEVMQCIHHVLVEESREQSH